MVRYGTIGTNYITDLFANGASVCKNLVYEAVYSRREETGRAFADKYGVKKVYTDLKEMAEDPEIDGVYIASPNCFHRDQALLMLEHGKHVLCEKPAVSNSREWDTLMNAAEERGRILLEGMRSVYDPGFAAIREYLPKLGKIRRATFQFCQYSSRYDRFKAGIVENAFRPELSNGALMDIGVYCIHPLVRLFGLPEKISGEAVFLENGVDGEGSILLNYGEMVAEVIYSKITGCRMDSIIQGEAGNLRIDRIQDTRNLIFEPRKAEAEEIRIEKEENNMVYEAEAWCRMIRNQDLREARHHMEATRMELQVMDRARREMGITFPADVRGQE